MPWFRQPDVDGASGGVALAIDALEAKAVKRMKSISDQLAGNMRPGVLYPMWYDGVQFRLLVGSTAPRLNRGTCPACTNTQRGQFWHLFGLISQEDSMSICAKDSGGAYDWRRVY